MPRDTVELQPVSPGLLYVNDDDPGLRRIKSGAGFDYRDPDGARVDDAGTLDRIRALAIPPAWTEVWICPSPRGHIQATGRDQRGRKQYRYHDGWRRDRDGLKFGRMIAFGRALPKLRAKVEKDLVLRGLPRNKVIAAVVRLMELTLIRIGNEAYAQENKTFGLTTLRDRHAKLSSVGGTFQFKGKSGVVHTTGFRDRRLARIVKACQDVPGQRLFQYLDDDGQRRSVESADVNAYIRAAMGEDFSAKDFRTWAGTLAAARALCLTPKAASATEAKRNVNTCVKAVAGLLGNTAAVCRGSYIHPLVLESYQQGVLPLKPGRSERAFELATIRFLEAAQASCAEA
ncbi:DNA topoisomerase IB [Caulobacter sp. FWC2]|uniref:DNA topoisomerase IB n=1 Tax=Caulobacter sp. FWC2 TaxID=69664 RepID=UPI000C14D098|nr:DNA topoisomerase IB [Caulobacter sp. FWC2]PIB91341.1 DNA topoisomerase [Caulobacter sp. FWC2]